jgi:hypothetical protein
MKRADRFTIFLSRLEKARPAQGREDALALMSQIMDEVEDELSGLDRSNYGERMHVYGFQREFGWKDMDGDPCYWDDSVRATHRTHLYHDGRILITAIKKMHVVVLDKPGINLV